MQIMVTYGEDMSGRDSEKGSEAWVVEIASLANSYLIDDEAPVG